jgi:hypothetical protein
MLTDIITADIVPSLTFFSSVAFCLFGSQIIGIVKDVCGLFPATSTTHVLTKDDIDEFRRRGVLVLRSVIKRQEVQKIKEEFHQYLCSQNVDPDNLAELGNELAKLSSTGGAGGILDVFYADFKLPLNEHPAIVSTIMELWQHTYADCSGIFTHPFGKFDSQKGYMYIDRVCFRVPDSISKLFGHTKKTSLQRSLTPHIDCCPQHMYEDVGDKKFSKWRPIQAFIALTDSLEPDVGGFEGDFKFDLMPRIIKT